MVRIFYIFIFLIIDLYAKDVNSNSYENNCVKCHKNLPVSIDKYFYRYLLKYSGEKAVKKAMSDYLKNPTKEKTIMPEAFINRFGVKPKIKLSNEDLDDALDTYWEKYKIFGKLK